MRTLSDDRVDTLRREVHPLTRTQFRQLFVEAVSEAARLAIRQLGRPVAIPTAYWVQGVEATPPSMSLDEAVDALYLGPNLSRAVIDVGIVISGDRIGVGWVVASGHEPRTYDSVWDPGGLGPFKPVGGVGHPT